MKKLLGFIVLGLLYFGNAYAECKEGNCSNGTGTMVWPNGDQYVGEWKEGNKHGQGKYTYPDGTKKEGVWKDNKFMYAKKPTSTPTPNSKIEGYKIFCSEIGFTPGTEKFGECVVEAMKKG